MREIPGFERLSDRYEGSALRALLLAPAIASLLGVGVHLSRILQALIVADAEREGGSEERWNLLNEHLPALLTLGTLQQYLMTLAIAALSTVLVLAPAAWICLDRRWSIASLKILAGVLGLLPAAAITVRVLWAGVNGPPVTGLTTILIVLLNGLIPLATVTLFLRELRPLQSFEQEDLRMDESDADRMPFLAQASRPQERAARDTAGRRPE